MDDTEDLLARYRPAGPPADLRARVVQATEFEATRRRRLVLAWLAPAAAAAAAVVFSILAAGARADVASQFSEIDRVREAMVAELRTALGGDDVAEQLARRLIAIQEQASRDEAAPDLSAPPPRSEQ